MEAQESKQHLGMLLQFLSPAPNSVKLTPLITTTDVWEVDVDIFIWNGVKHFVYPSDIPGKCCYMPPEK